MIACSASSSGSSAAHARAGRDQIDHPRGARDDLANAAAGAMVMAQSAPSIAVMKRGPINYPPSWRDVCMTEIHRASVQISRPMGTDPGTVEQACYFIEKGNLIVLCHRDGTPIMREALRVGRRRGDPPPLVRWERKLAR